MKIIGKTNSGFIIQADDMELQRLCGYYLGHEGNSPDLKVGSEIKVHSMYETLYQLTQRKSELEKISLTLHTVADLLKATQPIIQELAEQAERK